MRKSLFWVGWVPITDSAVVPVRKVDFKTVPRIECGVVRRNHVLQKRAEFGSGR